MSMIPMMREPVRSVHPQQQLFTDTIILKVHWYVCIDYYRLEICKKKVSQELEMVKLEW